MELVRDILGFCLLLLVVGIAVAKDGEDIIKIHLEDGSEYRMTKPEPGKVRVFWCHGEEKHVFSDGSVSNAPARPKGKQVVDVEGNRAKAKEAKKQ